VISTKYQCDLLLQSIQSRGGSMTLGLTALELARIQFAFTVSFHIIFPAISIGLASFLAVLEWLEK
jgi:hypothetical protein